MAVTGISNNQLTAQFLLNAQMDQLATLDDSQIKTLRKKLSPQEQYKLASQIHRSGRPELADHIVPSASKAVRLSAKPADTRAGTVSPKSKANYSHQAAKTGGKYSSNTRAPQLKLADGRVVSAETTANFVKMKMAKDPDGAREFFARRGFEPHADGSLTPLKSAAQKEKQKSQEGGISPWLAAGAGFLLNGLPGAATGFAIAKLTSGGKGVRDMAGLGMASGAFTGTSGLTASGDTTLKVAAGLAIASGLPTDGIEFQMRKRMRSMAADAQDNDMINMINNKGIPIEDLLFYFMSFMASKYEDKLREKMEEAALAEKRERRMENRKEEAKMEAATVQGVGGAVSSVASMLGPVGIALGAVTNVGTNMAGRGIEMAAQKKNDLDAALNGGGKSSTQLANEVTFLMDKWKRLNEMLSNLLKSIHDMAMTPIRNLR